MDVKGSYLEHAINAATPERKLLALLDGAVRFIHRARTALAANQLEECHRCTVKAQDIYLELLVALDPEAGEYVPHLQGLYYLLYDVLLDANVRKDETRYAEGQQIAERIRDLWQEVVAAAREQALAAPAEPADEVPQPAPAVDSTPGARLNIAG